MPINLSINITTPTKNFKEILIWFNYKRLYIIAGHYGAVYAVDAQPDAADAEPDSLYVNYTTGEAWLTHDNQNWVTISDDHHDVLLVENFPAVADAELNVLYISSTDEEARITGDNQQDEEEFW